MAQYDGAIRIATKITTKDAEESLASLEWQIKKSAKYMDELRSKMDALKDQKIPTKDYKKMQEELSKAEKELSGLVAKQSEMEGLGVTSGGAWNTLNEEIAKASDNVDTIKEKMYQLEESGKAFTLGKDTAQYKAMEQQLRYEEEAIKKAGEHYQALLKSKDTYKKLADAAKKSLSSISSALKNINSFISRFGKLVKSAFSNFGKSTDKASKNAHSLEATFKNILKYGFGIRSLFALVNKFRTAVKEGFSNLYNDKIMSKFKNSVDNLKASILILKNAFAAAFRPIVEIAIPYIQKLIDYMIQLMNVVGQFMAAITGQEKYTKAVKQTTAAIKDQNKAQNKQLSNLDNLNNLTSDMGSGADAGGVMFEEVPVENGFKNVANNVKDILSRFFEPLKKAWNSQGKSVMKAWKYAIDEIGRLAKRVGSDFLEVWQQSKTVKIFKDILQIIKDIGLTVGHLAKNFREAWEENDTGLHILENIRDIIGVIIANVKHAADATVKWAENLNFTPLLEAVERFTDSLEPVMDTLSGILTDFYEQVLLPLGKWTLEEGLPELLDVFTAFNEKVDWVALRENLKEFWDHLEPFAETVGEGLILFIERVSDLVADFLNSETFINFLHELEDWMDSVTPEDVADGIEKLIKALVGLKIAVIGLGALVGIAKFTVAMVQFGQAIKTVAEVISSSKIVEAIASLGGLRGILTADLATVFGAGTATEIGVTLGTGIIAALGGALAGGLTAKFWNRNVIAPLEKLAGMDEIAYFTENFGWFGEDGTGLFATLGSRIKEVGSNIKEAFNTSATSTISKAFLDMVTDIREGTILTDEALQNAQRELGLTEEKMETLRTLTLNANPVLKEFAEALNLKDASAETLTYIVAGFSEIKQAGELSETSLNSMNDAAKDFFNGLSNNQSAIDHYIKKIDDMDISLDNASETLNSLSEELTNGFNTDKLIEFGKNIMRGIGEGIKEEKIKSLRDKMLEIVGEAKEILGIHSPSTVFEGFGKYIIEGLLNGLKEKWKTVVDWITSKIEWLTNKLNGITGKITSAFTGFGNNNSKALAFSTRAASTPYAANPAFATLSTAPIPKLATGAVIPANKEFLAVLGDQKHGTNIEAPLEMMKQANKEGFLEVLNQLGLSSSSRGQEINLNLTVECEGYRLLQLIQKLDTEFFKQSGRHAFT